MGDGPAGNLILNSNDYFPIRNIDLAAKYDKFYSAGAYDSYVTFNLHAAERKI